jgi:hypothetical protein
VQGIEKDALAVGPVPYRTNSTCSIERVPIPLWTKFLDRVTAQDKELQSYLQRMAGYCMTGVTSAATGGLPERRTGPWACPLFCLFAIVASIRPLARLKPLIGVRPVVVKT